MTYPLCFESEEHYIQWIKFDDVALGMRQIENHDPCKDCTPSYAASMRLEGRCEHPEKRLGNPYNVKDEPMAARRSHMRREKRVAKSDAAVAEEVTG